jgi:hypothetical protein
VFSDLAGQICGTSARTWITVGLQIAEMSDAFALPIALVNCPGRYAAHLAAVVPNHLMMEVLDAGRDVVFPSDHRLEGGQIVLADAPDLGITFDEQRLAEHVVERPTPASSSAAYRRAEGFRDLRAGNRGLGRRDPQGRLMSRSGFGG